MTRLEEANAKLTRAENALLEAQRDVMEAFNEEVGK